MNLSENSLLKLIQQVIKEEESEDKEKSTDSEEESSPPEDKETDFQDLPINFPEDPFKKDVKESKIKLKNLMKENFWNQAAQMKGWEAPPKERRWSKSMNDGLGHLTEFEANKGGRDYVKEGPSYEYANYMKKIEKAENNQAKEVNKFVQLLMKKGLKKEATAVASKYVRGVADFDNFLKTIYGKLT